MAIGEKKVELNSVIAETKYLKFVLSGYKTKTNIYEVQNKNSGSMLGMIEWYAHWRQYIFSTRDGVVFNTDCLDDIATFIRELMKARKNKRNAKKREMDV